MISGMMKKRKQVRHAMVLRKIFLLPLITASVFISVSAYSWTLGAGVTSYYSYWDPAWSENYNSVEIDPALLVGPVVSLSFGERYTLTGLLMMNANQPHSKYSVPMPGSGEVGIDSEMRRMEGELNLMYSITGYFRILAGYKMQDYQETYQPDMTTVPVGYTNKIDFWDTGIWINGPGLGIVVSFPLGGNIGFSISTSLIYMSIKYRERGLMLMGMDIYSEGKDYSYTGLGNNSSVSFGYYIESINTAISLGGRFQYLRYQAKGDAPELGNDYYYGATLSAVYYFR